MTYNSVDQLQKALAERVFHYAQDKKKAAGRALGTLVEIIAFYMLRSWGFRDSIVIERRIPEYANPEITHNVEYSLHPVLSRGKKRIEPIAPPLTSSKMRRAFGIEGAGKSMALLSREGVLRNSCVLADSATGPIRVAHLDQLSGDSALVSLLDLHAHPYAIVECKRVGVEEGMKKGPQTIEKAKQGAYVARTVSSLQKLRRPDGGVDGVIVRHDDSLLRKPYARLLDDVISSNDADLLDGFILTVGVVSNHGNWFTTDDHNKELRVLAQSYDWLLFLTDQALSQFIDQLLLNPSAELRPARGAFLQSYSGTKGKNRFTKVQMGVEADASLQRYFLTHEDRLSEWFNVITPKAGKLSKLRAVLKKLRDKDWTEIKKP